MHHVSKGFMIILRREPEKRLRQQKVPIVGGHRFPLDINRLFAKCAQNPSEKHRRGGWGNNNVL